MKVYFAIKYHSDNENRKLIEDIFLLLEKHNFEPICIAKDFEKWGAKEFSPSELMEISFQEIDQSDLVIIELSEKGVGLGIEAGYAYASHKPIITIAKIGSDISTTLKGVSEQVYIYENLAELERFFEDIWKKIKG